jgi:hypothetical protein
VLICSLLGAGEAFNRLLPGARGNAVVGAGQIRLGNLEIQDGLTFRVISGFDNLLGSSLSVVVRLVRLPVVLSTQ